MSARPILVTGGTGQVGMALARAADVVAPDRAALDLDDPAAIADWIGSRDWAAVVNAAAYTAVDRAESEVAAAWRLNAVAPALLAAETARRGIPIVQVSTDYVFDGAKPAPYLPGDATAPLNVYGASKLGGEIAVRSANPRHAVVRTAWVVGARRTNFVTTMLRLAGERAAVRVVADQQGSPTSADDLAAALLVVARRLAAADAPAGTWHFANGGEASWCDLACAVFASSAARGGPVAAVEPIATADFPTAARRPASSRLDTRDLERAFGIRPRPWREAVDAIVAELIGARPAVADAGA